MISSTYFAVLRDDNANDLFTKTFSPMPDKIMTCPSCQRHVAKTQTEAHRHQMLAHMPIKTPASKAPVVIVAPQKHVLEGYTVACMLPQVKKKTKTIVAEASDDLLEDQLEVAMEDVEELGEAADELGDASDSTVRNL